MFNGGFAYSEIYLDFLAKAIFNPSIRPINGTAMNFNLPYTYSFTVG